MICISDNQVQLMHWGLGKYKGQRWMTVINPKYIQAIRVAGPELDVGFSNNQPVFQVIYSNRGYTETFAISGEEYVQLLIFMSLGQPALDWFLDNLYLRYPELVNYSEIAIRGDNKGGMWDRKSSTNCPDARKLIDFVRKGAYGD